MDAFFVTRSMIEKDWQRVAMNFNGQIHAVVTANEDSMYTMVYIRSISILTYKCKNSNRIVRDDNEKVAMYPLSSYGTV